ncbi:hypothetical protein [Hymenobacter armeniacus]|uniref:Outer membrane protein beta-barrel domain-containing protein n=1 Tax=Hymenobacter armeniacus TaxID=2771358 RepID=A0ABR8JXT4_9BACT|nr:hypothetical protein [Hymenobacter armeniacus]MBD2723616.1 hypothetical protein [Hymenobacter armeniacus]
MKKIGLLALALASVQAAQGQSIAAGTVSLGGNIGYSRTANKQSATYNQRSGGGNYTYSSESTTSQFNLALSGGYFVADNLAVGLSVAYIAASTIYKNTSSTSPQPINLPDLSPNTNTRVGAFGQYYKMFGEQFGLVGTLGAGYQHTKNNTYDNGGSGAPVAVSYVGNGYYADLTPGIVFFPIPKLGISASIGSLGFSHLSFDQPEYPNSNVTKPSSYESTLSTFGANFGLNQLQFGGTYYLGR